MSSNQPINKNRIGYIDALRGFTMILVVCVHIATFSIVNVNPYSDFFALFRMPLFFFISGLILYKKDRIWDFKTSIKFLSNKFLVQIIPTAIFLSLFLFIQSVEFRLRSLNGYWFTVALFEFFIVYVLFNFICRKQNVTNIILTIIGVVFYYLAYDPYRFSDTPFFNDIIVHHLGFFIFFLLGTMVKKYFDKISRHIFGNNLIMMIIISLMLVGAIFFIKDYCVVFETKLALSILGILSFFYFFMKNGDYMDNSRIGKSLQYIGRRTLDIYLLHYFFVYGSMSWIKNFNITSPTIKFITSIFICFIIIGLCLLVSKFLRTNPLLGKILFGAKIPPKKD